jgi:hypothetical protein
MKKHSNWVSFTRLLLIVTLILTTFIVVTATQAIPKHNSPKLETPKHHPHYMIFPGSKLITHEFEIDKDQIGSYRISSLNGQLDLKINRVRDKQRMLSQIFIVKGATPKDNQILFRGPIQLDKRMQKIWKPRIAQLAKMCNEAIPKHIRAALIFFVDFNDASLFLSPNYSKDKKLNQEIAAKLNKICNEFNKKAISSLGSN